jgi:cytochrome c556
MLLKSQVLQGGGMMSKLYSVVAVLAVCVCLVTAVAADETTDAYKKLMQPAAAANVNLQKVVQTDLSAAAQSASDVQAAFAKIEAFWSAKGTSDAVGFAKAIQAAAKDAHDAAAAGNKDGAVAAAQKIGATCGSCHMAHRNRLPDGTFELK